MKLAVCVYGQPRSWRYTTEWILNQYTHPDVEVDYFCAIKDYQNDRTVAPEEIAALIDAYKPVRHEVISRGEYLGRANYSFYYKSMFAPIGLKNIHEARTHAQYDAVAFQRLDAMTGPDRNWLDRMLLPLEQTNTVHTFRADTMFFGRSGMATGMDDSLIIGDARSMDLVGAMLINTIHTPHQYDRTLLTPHNIMTNLCRDNNITIRDHEHLRTTIVREQTCVDVFGKKIPTIANIAKKWKKLEW